MPLLSVIIPTHNRARYAIPTIHAVLAASVEIEVVVSDSSEIDEISSTFTGHPDAGRIKFLRPAHDFSVVDNFNYAMRHATGDYLVFIGDDDFVSTQIADVARWAKNQEIDAIKFSFPALYYWHDFMSSTRWNAAANTISISPFTGDVLPHDASIALTEALSNFGGGVGEMPRAYAGMVSRKLTEAICSKHGALFGGVSPDIYSAALISIETTRCVRVDYPVIIPGASGASTSGQSANGKHIGGLRDNPHIGAFKSLIWDARIPEFYGVQTVWSYSLLKAVERTPTLLRQVSFYRLYVKCILLHYAYLPYVLVAIKAYRKQSGLIRLTCGILFASFLEAARIVSKLITRWSATQKNETIMTLGHLSDTMSAQQKLEIYLAKSPVRLTLRTLF